MSGVDMGPSLATERQEHFNILSMFVPFKIYFLICFYSILHCLFSDFEFFSEPGKTEVPFRSFSQIILNLFCWILKSCISNVKTYFDILKWEYSLFLLTSFWI